MRTRPPQYRSRRHTCQRPVRQCVSTCTRAHKHIFFALGNVRTRCLCTRAHTHAVSTRSVNTSRRGVVCSFMGACVLACVSVRLCDCARLCRLSEHAPGSTRPTLVLPLVRRRWQKTSSSQCSFRCQRSIRELHLCETENHRAIGRSREICADFRSQRWLSALLPVIAADSTGLGTEGI